MGGAPPLSGWWRRVGAYLLDTLIGIGFSIVPGVVLAIIVGADNSSDVEFVFAPFGILFTLLYYPLTERRPGQHNGQSWGKQALGIRILRQDGQSFNAGNSIVREFLVRGILMGICFIVQILNVLWPLWDDINQALHDKIVSTVVVQA